MALGCAAANASAINPQIDTNGNCFSSPSLHAALQLDCWDGYLARQEDRF
jgi:hypothetical protein